VKTLKISALALVSALTLAACDGGDGVGPGGLGQGQFEGEVSGVLDTFVDGEARSGYWSNPSFHDVIELVDFTREVRITIYESEDEFFEGRWSIDDENDFDSRIVAYVEDLRTGETFASVSGTLDLNDVRSGSIRGSAVFTAESDWEFDDFITVDVVFFTDFDGNISFNLAPSLSAGAKSSR
jgi:hypothetical protein